MLSLLCSKIGTNCRIRLDREFQSATIRVRSADGARWLKHFESAAVRFCGSLIRFQNGGLSYVKDFAVWNAILGGNSYSSRQLFKGGVFPQDAPFFFWGLPHRGSPNRRHDIFRLLAAATGAYWAVHCQHYTTELDTTTGRRNLDRYPDFAISYRLTGHGVRLNVHDANSSIPIFRSFSPS